MKELTIIKAEWRLGNLEYSRYIPIFSDTISILATVDNSHSVTSDVSCLPQSESYLCIVDLRQQHGHSLF